jgi:hypothetical protein
MSFQIDTTNWRLPPRSARPRIDLPGVEDLEVSSEGIRAKDTISSVINTSSWTLPKHEEELETPKLPKKKKRAPGEPGPKDARAPKDDRGRPALFGGSVGVHSEDVRHELRRLAGLPVSEAFGDKPGSTQQAIIAILTKSGPMGMSDLFDALRKKTGLKGKAIQNAIYLMLQRDKLIHPDHDADKVALPSKKSESVRHEQRRLTGLERSEHIEFATGLPYRKLPDDSRVLIETREAPSVCFQPEPGRVVMTDEMRRLCGMLPSSSLPHAIHDADAPRQSRSAGILDDETESGQQFVERVLQESLPFFEISGGGRWGS